MPTALAAEEVVVDVQQQLYQQLLESKTEGTADSASRDHHHAEAPMHGGNAASFLTSAAGAADDGNEEEEDFFAAAAPPPLLRARSAPAIVALSYSRRSLAERRCRGRNGGEKKQQEVRSKKVPAGGFLPRRPHQTLGIRLLDDNPSWWCYN